MRDWVGNEGVATMLIGEKETAGPDKQAVAPIPDNLQSMLARQRRADRRYAGSGRAGTVLSENTSLG